MRYHAIRAARLIVLGTATSAISLATVWSLLVTRGDIPEYVGAVGVAALVCPLIVLTAFTCAAVWLAFRGQRALAWLLGSLAVLGNGVLVSTFSPALIKDVGTWHVQSIPILALLCALLVAVSLLVPRSAWAGRRLTRRCS
jgi:hypothetical protein